MNQYLRRRLQNITLGVDDEPITLPAVVCARAATANRFSIVGVPLNPRKQNLRILITQMPKFWGVRAVGRILGNNKFQFIFQSTEEMNLVIRRGRWSFNEWMLAIQPWTPNLPDAELKIIPLWVQIRGIPLQFLSTTMIGCVGSFLGPVVAVEFDEAQARVDFVRVKINWDVEKPLRFQRNYQFGEMVNTILKFKYEKLRNLCTTCGMLSHDAKECTLRFDNLDEDAPFQVENEDSGVQEQNVFLAENVVEINAQEEADVDVPHVSLNEGIINYVFPTFSGSSDIISYVPREGSILAEDRDLAVETIRYMQAKMAKGKFRTEDFRDVFEDYVWQSQGYFFNKRKRQEVEEMLNQFDNKDNRTDLCPVAKKYRREESQFLAWLINQKTEAWRAGTLLSPRGTQPEIVRASRDC